jgi:hypothetical protein
VFDQFIYGFNGAFGAFGSLVLFLPLAFLSNLETNSNKSVLEYCLSSFKVLTKSVSDFLLYEVYLFYILLIFLS